MRMRVPDRLTGVDEVREQVEAVLESSTTCEARLQGLADHQLLDADERSIGPSDQLEHRDDAWMIEAGDQSCLTQETLDGGLSRPPRSRMRRSGELLHRNLASDESVEGAPDHGLSAPAELVETAILLRAFEWHVG